MSTHNDDHHHSIDANATLGYYDVMEANGSRGSALNER
jgi:hypothetical protein